jgi:hypothetical protein
VSLREVVSMSRLSVDHSGDPHYDTNYQRSLRHYITREALPSESNYRNIHSIHQERPTLDDLHNATYKPKQVTRPDIGVLISNPI